MSSIGAEKKWKSVRDELCSLTIDTGNPFYHDPTISSKDYK